MRTRPSRVFHFFAKLTFEKVLNTLRMLCVLCIESITGYGNNAEPVAQGTCCDSCNISFELQERLRLLPTIRFLEFFLASSASDA